MLSGVSLRLNAGEAVCLVGPNGAGKSTLMMALVGLLPAERGDVLLDDRSLRHWARRRIARRIAYVPQAYEGFGGFLVGDVLETARFAHLHPLQRPGGDDRDVIRAQVAVCGLEGLEDRALDSLSAGERQKVWLAAALVQEADFLLLDEPTAALDPRYLAAFIDLLDRLREAGRAILLVVHDLNVAAALYSRVIALREGQVRYDGPIDHFLDPPWLREVYGAEFDIAVCEDGRRRLVFPRHGARP